MSDVRARAPLSVVRIQRATMQDDVYRQAKELILNGELAPGQSITIQWLADAFGVSAMPVREAILRLTAEKALTIVAGRSLGIPPLSRERLADLTRTRLEIEALAVSWAVPNLDAEVRSRLDRLIAEMDNIKPDNEARKVYLRANREFHFALYQASGSEAMLGIIESLWLQVSPYFNLLQERGNFVVSNRHHRALVDALAARDPARAIEAVRADIGDAASVLDTILA
ncbi:MAG TPA: GntR family transcriptional regulator [Lichenihabitans sp.]|jgi:DNA-binding GntR family transcriptional regulator|nr:GntR family transcriptional regulator [Lichenihabitans sp.]